MVYETLNIETAQNSVYTNTPLIPQSVNFFSSIGRPVRATIMSQSTMRISPIVNDNTGLTLTTFNVEERVKKEKSLEQCVDKIKILAEQRAPMSTMIERATAPTRSAAAITVQGTPIPALKKRKKKQEDHSVPTFKCHISNPLACSPSISPSPLTKTTAVSTKISDTPFNAKPASLILDQAPPLHTINNPCLGLLHHDMSGYFSTITGTFSGGDHSQTQQQTASFNSSIRDTSDRRTDGLEDDKKYEHRFTQKECSILSLLSFAPKDYASDIALITCYLKEGSPNS